MSSREGSSARALSSSSVAAGRSRSCVTRSCAREKSSSTFSSFASRRIDPLSRQGDEPPRVAAVSKRGDERVERREVLGPARVRPLEGAAGGRRLASGGVRCADARVDRRAERRFRWEDEERRAEARQRLIPFRADHRGLREGEKRRHLRRLRGCSHDHLARAARERERLRGGGGLGVGAQRRHDLIQEGAAIRFHAREEEARERQRICVSRSGAHGHEERRRHRAADPIDVLGGDE